MIDFSSWLTSLTESKIEYHWTQQALNGPYIEIPLFRFAENPKYKPVLGLIWLEEVPKGTIHRIQEKLPPLPTGVNIFDGWNSSYHDARYGTPAIFVMGKNHKEVRNKLKTAHKMILDALTQVEQPDLAQQRMQHRSILRPGD